MSTRKVNTVDISIWSVVKVIAVLLILVFLYVVRDIIVLIFASVILSAAICPWVDWFEKKKIPRALGIFIIYFSLFLIVALTIALLVPTVLDQVRQLSGNFPYYYDKIASAFNALPQASGVDNITEGVQSGLESLGSFVGQATQGIFSTLSGIFGGIISFFVVLVTIFYLSLEQNGIKKFLVTVTPNHYHDKFSRLGSKIENKIGRWFRSQLLLCLIIGALTFIGLKLFGIKYALLLALIAGVTEIIPYIGPILGAVPAIFLAFAQSPILALWAIVLYVVIQQIENHILLPVIMRKAVGLHPIIVIVVILVGAKLGGILGAVLAVPVATAVAVFFSDFFGDKFLTTEIKDGLWKLGRDK